MLRRCLLVCSVLLPADHLRAQQDEKSLAGIKAFVVEVRASAQVNSRLIRELVELELRRSSIKVIPQDDSATTEGAAGLVVTVAVVTEETNLLYGGFVLVEVVQAASLLRSSDNRGLFVTWRTGGPLLAGKNRIQSATESSVRSEMTSFLNTYLAANPRSQ